MTRLQKGSAQERQHSALTSIHHRPPTTTLAMEAPDHVSLLLRLALLESLTLGQTESQGQQAPVLPASNPALLLRSHNAESQFKESIEKYKSIVQFVNEYKDNKRYLQPTGLATPSINYTLDLDGANGGAAAKKGQEGKDETRSVPLLSAQSAIALLLEAEPDLKQLDRDLRTCEGYEGRGTAGAGKLAGESWVVRAHFFSVDRPTRLFLQTMRLFFPD